MASVIDQNCGRADAHTLAIMAEPLRELIIDEHIEREEGRALLLIDGAEIFEGLVAGP